MCVGRENSFKTHVIHRNQRVYVDCIDSYSGSTFCANKYNWYQELLWIYPASGNGGDLKKGVCANGVRSHKHGLIKPIIPGLSRRCRRLNFRAWNLLVPMFYALQKRRALILSSSSPSVDIFPAQMLCP